MYICVRVGQRLNVGFFFPLDHYSPYFLRQDLSLNLEPADLVSSGNLFHCVLLPRLGLQVSSATPSILIKPSDLILCIQVFCLHVYLFTACRSGAHEGKSDSPWTWSYR